MFALNCKNQYLVLGSRVPNTDFYKKTLLSDFHGISQRTIFYFFVLKKIILFFVGIAWFYGCANITQISGGDKDTQPPRIDSSEVFTPNFQTNFQEKFIYLPFDEWVVLNDVINQVVISPPLEKPIEMKLKKRTVIIDFSKETLRENTTYTINFGEAIKDLNEGNFQKNFRYIFSTGPIIDSLEVKGNVIDAMTEQPIEDVLVMLYDDLSDSIVHKERPYYFAKTDKNGRFTIPFVKQDTFKILALKDENANYKYDLPNEKIAFSTSAIITGDSIANDIRLRFFTEKKEAKAFLPTSPHYGYIPIVFTNDELSEVKVQLLEPIEGLKTLVYAEKDTLKFWYKDVNLDSLTLIVYDNVALKDTFTVKLKTKEKYKNTTIKTKIPKTAISQNPDEAIEIVFNRPINKIDTAKIILLEDTLNTLITPQISVDTLRPNVLILNYKWKESKPYQLILQDSTIFDFHQFPNDSIKINYFIKARKDFGNVTVTADSLNIEKAYIIQLLTAEDVVIGEFYADGKTSASKKFLSLEPKDYKLRVLIDENKNKKWDTGDYPNTLPEPVVIGKETTTLRANWELDLSIILK